MEQSAIAFIEEIAEGTAERATEEKQVTINIIEKHLWPDFDFLGASKAFSARSVSGRPITERRTYRMRKVDKLAMIEIGCDKDGMPAEILSDWWEGLYRVDAARETPKQFLNRLKQFAL